MWTKLLAVALIALFILAAGYLVSRGTIGTDAAGSARESVQIEEEPVQRSARNIMMFEKRTDSGSSLVVRAQELTQQSNDVINIDGFTLERSNGVRVKGVSARYETDRSRLKVIGPLSVETADGWKADLTGLMWDRQSGHAVTYQPVTVQGGKGVIRGNMAEFTDDFNSIRLSGGVYAKVAQDILPD